MYIVSLIQTDRGRIPVIVIIFLVIALMSAATFMYLAGSHKEKEQSEILVEPDLEHNMASHFNDQYTDDLEGIMRRRHIRVLTTFNKTNYFLFRKGEYGFEYSLLKDYEKFINTKTKKGLRVVLEFRPVSRDMLMPLLEKGYGDIAAAGLTITPGRAEVIDFTKPYITGIDEVIVTHRKAHVPDSVSDLSGQSLFVRKSSSYYESILSLNRDLKKNGRKPVKVIAVDETLETEDILELVNSGAIGMTVSDIHIARIWAKVLDDIVVHEDLKLREDGRIAWMVRKNNPELRESMNRFIRRHRQGTFVGNVYFKRYFDNNKWLLNPMSESQRKKHKTYEALFRKYGERYGFDWMLLMAMAFQESGLNNKRKSSAGAVGIMQVRPSTARDKRVAVKNVHLLENNIHAGVKYLAVLRDVYFAEDDILEQDRIRLALAAYNAGPSRIKRSRKMAEKMNLDSTRWFRNVEIATLKHVSQEPVRYVSNINKYYIVYGLYEQNREVRINRKEDLK